MRLKTLRKERPTFEIEGAIVNGSRIDITNTDYKPTKHRSNALFALPASLKPDSPILNVSPLGYTDELNNNNINEQVIGPPVSQTSESTPYQAIEAAYLERGIRIRLSPTKMTTNGQQSEKKSFQSFHRRPAFVHRNPCRTSSVLNYDTPRKDQYSDTRSFSALQQTTTNDFEPLQEHNKSYTQSSQITEETPDDGELALVKTNENLNPVDSPDLFSKTYDQIVSMTSIDTDPDLMYMTKLLQQPNGESVRETIRRRAGLRGTFAVHRNPLTTNSNQPQSQLYSRQKSPAMNRSLTRNSTITVTPLSPSPDKIDQDIMKHVSRIRQRSISRETSMKSPRINTASTANSPTRQHTISITNSSPIRNNTFSITKIVPSRTNSMSNTSSLLRANTMAISTSPLRVNNNIDNHSLKRTSKAKSSKSMSLEPLQLLLSSTSHQASTSTNDLPNIKSLPINHATRSFNKRNTSTSISTTKTSNITNIPLREHSITLSTFRDESLSSMKTSTLEAIRQSNSCDSGYFDHSSTGGDIQSLTSSSLVQIQSSIPSVRLTSSTVRRSASNKKVSFYDEPSAVILTTTTYV